MRINKYLALHTDLSRRKADEAIEAGKVTVNGKNATEGLQIGPDDIVMLNDQPINQTPKMTTIILNKPIGYVCSRVGQGSPTIYQLLPPEFQHLNPVGRLDKDSSGLLLMTNYGDMANQLTHPRYQKTKIYKVTLNKSLEPLHQQMISDFGVALDDGPSKFMIEKTKDSLKITMTEGRNRQIRRTFEALGYTVTSLHRTHFGSFSLGKLQSGKTTVITDKNVV